MIHAERLGVILAPEYRLDAKFNAGMIREGDRVHMLYRRAENWDGASPNGFRYKKNFVAYALLDTKGRLLRDDGVPVIEPCCEFDKAGIEDPRIILFERVYYVFYTCYDLIQARVGISKTTDFKSFERIGVIPAAEFDKDAFIFPERIGGKVAYIHRIGSTIQIDYFDNIEDMLDESYWKSYDLGKAEVMTAEYPWEDVKIGGSVPPIKTADGWLFIYHGVGSDHGDKCYRMGAALLDLENPSKVIGRLPYPLLEPEEEYELKGDVDDVVFPTGAFLNGDDLYISYGGADSVVAMARLSLSELLDEFKNYPVD